jgi:hypothetical protein
MLASKLCTDVVLRVQARRPPPAFFAQAPSSFLISGRCRMRVLVDKASVSTLPCLAVKLSRCWPTPSSPRCQQAAPSPAMTGAPLGRPGPSSLQATRARRRWSCPSSRSCTRATAAAPTLSCSALLRVLAVRPPVAKIAGVLVPVR